MKRTLLFITCVLASLTLSAQEYYPEGTKWTEIRLDTLKYDSWYSKVGDKWVPNFETIEYEVKGDCISNYSGKFKCVYTNGPEWTDSLSLLIQEERDAEYVGHNCIKVSVAYRDNGGVFFPIWPGEAYQFDWSVGKELYFEDITMSNATSIERSRFYYGIIDEIKEGSFGGVRPLMYVDLNGKAPANDPNSPIHYVDTKGGRILQGIGITEWNDGECLFGPPNPYSALGGEYHGRPYRSMLVHFERDGEVLYDVWPDIPQNDYIPFVDAGKSWIVASSTPGQNAIDKVGYYIPLGIEEVNEDGKAYYKMKAFTNNTTETGTYLIREEDRKVYLFDTDTQREYLMFDYFLKAGDTYDTYSSEYQRMVRYEVFSVGDYTEGPKILSSYYDEKGDSMAVRYRYLRKWVVQSDIEKELCLAPKTWIEGVGSLEGPFANLYDTSSSLDHLAYVLYNGESYLPFTFNESIGKLWFGCNMPTSEEYDHSEDKRHQLIYELEGDRLHVYGKVLTRGGRNNYAYFFEESTDDPLVRKLNFEIQAIEPTPDPLPDSDGLSLHSTNFYVPNFIPNLNYVIVDNQGAEHPVVNKTPQNEYRPFVEEGKVWVVSGSAISDDASMVHWTDYCYFEGDTIVGGQICKLMKCVGNANGPIGAWYEQDRKVYYAHYGNLPFLLAYDFTLSSNDTIDTFWYPLVVYKKSGGIPGFKGSYYEFWHDNQLESRWLEGVGSESWPYVNHPWMYDGAEGVLLACYVDDEVIYYNSEVEDPYSLGAKKRRFDFTHTTKIQPKTPKRRSEEPSLYGEYNDKLLGVNLDPVDDAYLVRITNETGKVVYEKAIDAGTIVALNIDISSYATGRYTVTVENSQETFTGEFETQTTGIREVESGKRSEVRDAIYNLQGQRLSSMQKGLNIVNGKKVYVR